jgi:hypothetical protein
LDSTPHYTNFLIKPTESLMCRNSYIRNMKVMFCTTFCSSWITSVMSDMSPVKM